MRARDVMREEGPRALALRAAGELGYRRLLLFERETAGEPSGATSELALTFGFLLPAQLDAFELLQPGERARAEQRLARGSRCFATWLEDELVSVRWLAAGTPRIEYLDADLPLEPGELYHHDSFTSPAHRRRSISTVSQDRLSDALRAEAVARLIRAVLPENRAAMRDVARANFREAGRIASFGRGRMRRVVIRRRS